jgi:hypothetical protein
MRLRSSLLLVCLVSACYPDVDPILICHNGNCAGTGLYEDDTVEGLTESLALVTDGRPTFDGMDMDTFLYFDGTKSECFFAHDDLHPETFVSPRVPAQMIADYLQNDVVSWNGERFFFKVELKPTVAGANLFHTGQQLQQHAECVLDLVSVAVANSRHPVTVILDSTSECIHNELRYRIMQPEWQSLATNPNVQLLFSGPVVPARECIPSPLDIHSFYVRGWHDNAVDAVRPIMAWLDARSENSETLKIIRHLRPEYVASSSIQFTRGWLTGQ